MDDFEKQAFSFLSHHILNSALKGKRNKGRRGILRFATSTCNPSQVNVLMSHRAHVNSSSPSD